MKGLSKEQMDAMPKEAKLGIYGYSQQAQNGDVNTCNKIHNVTIFD